MPVKLHCTISGRYHRGYDQRERGDYFNHISFKPWTVNEPRYIGLHLLKWDSAIINFKIQSLENCGCGLKEKENNLEDWCSLLCLPVYQVYPVEPHKNLLNMYCLTRSA